jgi:hypothetical protein
MESSNPGHIRELQVLIGESEKTRQQRIHVLIGLERSNQPPARPSQHEGNGRAILFPWATLTLQHH